MDRHDRIRRDLVDRGYTREQILKILGGNFIRVMHEVEATAKRLQAEQPATAALSFEDIQLMLGNHVDQAEMVRRVNEKDVTFDLTDDRKALLKAQGATNPVLETIARAKR